MSVNWINGALTYSEGFITHLATDGAKYMFAFFGASAISLILTPVFREVARKIGMVDEPDVRRINTVTVPRGGGIAVFLSFHIVMLLLLLIMKTTCSPQFSCFWQWRFFLASGLLLLIGLIDDKRGLKPSVKLAGQTGVALILYFSGVSVGGIMVSFPAWLDMLVTVIWIVGAINAFNLIDGLDGLAAGLALIASLGLAGALLFTGQLGAMVPYLVLAGACLGFLRYNFHPASVFLGDTGSMFLGLCIATFPLMTGSRKELVASLGVPLLAMGVPLFDTVLAIWRRTVRAHLPRMVIETKNMVRIMLPDKDHMHHRLLRDTMNQRKVAIIMYVISILLVMVGLGGTLLKNRAPGLFMLAFLVAVFVIVRHLERVELWDTGCLIAQKRATLRKGLLVPLYMILDTIALCASWCLARWILELELGRLQIISDMLLFVVPVFIMLVVTKTYWRVWSRAQIRDFAFLGIAVVVGTTISVALVWLFGEHEVRGIRCAFLFTAFSIFPIVGMRLWSDSIRGVLEGIKYHILMNKKGTPRILVYGGGLRLRSFLREKAERPMESSRVIMGIIDEDINLKGRIIAGYVVLGGLKELGDLACKMKIDALVVTCRVEPEELQQIVAYAQALNIPVSLWSCNEVMLT